MGKIYKVFISLPMNGKTVEEVRTEMQRAYWNLKTRLPELHGLSSVMLESCFEDFKSDNPIKYLAKSIEVLADADIILFCKGWERARGCRIEHRIAEEYNKECILYE